MTTLIEWDAGALAADGATVVGTVNVVDLGDYDAAEFPQDISAAAYTYWNTAAASQYSARFYFHTPAVAWPDAAAAIFSAWVGGTHLGGINVAGVGAPGQLRWKTAFSTEAFRSGNGIIDLADIYRVEIQTDGIAGTMRGAVFDLQSDTALYDSGVQPKSVGAAVTRFHFGRITAQASLRTFGISRVKVVDTVGPWVGRHATDIIPETAPEMMGVWNGSALDDGEILGVWTGTDLVPTDAIFFN